MPKGSLELTEKRKNEIIDACQQVYQEQGFYGVTIKEISTALHMTRPAIYHYFESKEEILLGLLIREYEKWLQDLKDIRSGKPENKKELIKAIAESLSKREVMLRILNRNLFEIELNSRVERLADFKKVYAQKGVLLKELLKTVIGDFEEEEFQIFNQNFDAFLIGLYPFIHHTQKKLQAMQMAGMQLEEPGIGEMVESFLRKAL